MSATQQRCVFVGNIPYDATEEQLIEICKEVGPVVSFRLVVDRETGKPKGYGFCEYRDEETAASARRNLQGYEVNGRQLRVDYAENAKGVDRNREQDRGGPGLASNFDSQKHSGGAAIAGDPSISQPIGLSAAAKAAYIMAGTLGGPQTGIMSQGQSNVGGHDPLTLHLASMSKNQLYEVLYEMKALAQQNQQQARQILVSYPQFSKALFQIEIILGLVPPNMASKFRQSSNTPPQQTIQTVQPDSGIQSGQKDQMHLRHNQIQPGQQTQIQLEQNGQAQLLQQIPAQSIPIQQSMQTSLGQPPIQNLQQSQTQVSQPLLQSIQPVTQSLHVPVEPPLQPSQTTMIEPHVPSTVSSQSQQSFIQPGNIHSPPLPQQPRPSLQSHQSSSQVQSQQTQMTFKSSTSVHQQPSQPPFQHLGNQLQSATVIPFQKHTQPSLLNPPPLQQSYQVGSVSASAAISSVGSDAVGQSNGLQTLGADGVVQGGGGPNSVNFLTSKGADISWAQVPLSTGRPRFPAVSSRMDEPVGMSRDLAGCLNSSPSQSIIEDGSNRDYKAEGGGISGIISGSSDNVVGTSVAYSQGPSHTSVAGMPPPQQPMTEVTQLPLEMQSALLEQVMNLTAEQIKCLPPDQQQQVFQLQQLLRNK